MATEKTETPHKKALSVMEFFEKFPDNETADEWFLKTRWPDGIRCPHCDSSNVLTKTKHPTMPFQCRTCRKFFSIRTGTVMQASNLPSRTWLLAMFLMMTSVKGAASMRMHRDLNVTYKTAWFLCHRIRETWAKKAAPFDGPVEVDETYVGGLEKNKHSKKKNRNGRGTTGKTAVVGARDRATGEVRAEVVRSTTGASLQGFVRRTVRPGATVYTDEARAYRGMNMHGFRHKAVRHSSGEYVDGDVYTNGIESFWAIIKRGYKGTYHQLSSKHLHRYISEFVGRFNARTLSGIDQLRLMAAGMAGKRLRYKDLVADPPEVGIGQQMTFGFH